MTSQTRDAVEGKVRDALTKIVRSARPLIGQGEDYIWRPASEIFKLANEALAAISTATGAAQEQP